ncbi:hypothetical protein OG298_45465 (plasmid) [Streptomyces sp. NBC_01005]|uniref:hypothetical protein n=1 Tax=Streptomyces sp. NBC_01005 TaxID=2903715 RepID=UPI002F912276|nr:hypothetical protein OG298_45465 [Streptomyces sp. NBC_01005]
MAKLYESEAEVVIDGAATPIYVRFTVLTEGSFKRWLGAFGSNDLQLAQAAMDADEVLLRMPDGKEGRIVVTNGLTEQGISFTGSGPSPT